MKKILILLAVCPAFFMQMLCADSKTIVLGGKDGWPQLEKMDGITTGQGRFGYTSLELKKNTHSISDYTDLLLHFDDSNMADSSGHYDVIQNNFVLTDNSIMGKGAALSPGSSNGLVLRGKPGSMFGSGGRIGSFYIEFWLNPSISENGERFFMWRSSRNMEDYSIFQTITSTFVNGHLEWIFSNIFEGFSKNDGNVVLSGISTIIPDKWTRHRISFNEENGLLEYRVDGITEALIYLTSSGRESGDIYQPVLGVPADIILGSQYTGRIDDFRIEERSPGEDYSSITTFVDETRYDMYKIDGGRFETQPIMVGQGSVLNSVEALMNTPAQTAVNLFVRSGDNRYNWTNSYPEWIPVTSGKSIAGVTGRYFQLAAELLPDGGGNTSPSITQLTINYTELAPPLPPFSVRAESGDSCVTLSWDYSVDDSAGGYYVYYGERPGEYLGRIAVEGPSPINVGNVKSVKITGLKNGAIYYFAVSTWSRFDTKINGQLSNEVFARPQK